MSKSSNSLGNFDGRGLSSAISGTEIKLEKLKETENIKN